MNTTPQNQNQNEQVSQSTQENVIIDRSKLISDIMNTDESTTQRYRLMLEAILEQTNNDVSQLKREMTDLLRQNVQESLHIGADEVTSFTSPIELKIDTLLANLQSGDVEAFAQSVTDIRQALQDKQTEQRLIDIFENDSVQEKRQVMQFLASTENSTQKQAFDRILQKFLPASVLQQYQEIIAQEQASLEQKYNLLDDLIRHNSASIPGVEGLGDLIFLVNEVVNTGVEQTGSVQGFFNQLLSEGSNLLDRLIDSDITNALTPLRAYNVAAASLDISKRQLRSLSQMTVGQLRSIVENQEQMNLYSQQSPHTYEALMKLKRGFFNSNGPVDKLRAAATTMAKDAYGLTSQFVAELFNFSANIEDEKIDTIITGFYSEFARNERGVIILQKGAVLYRWFRKAHAAGNMFMNPFKPYNLLEIGGDARASAISRINQNKPSTPLEKLKHFDSVLDEIRSGKNGTIPVDNIATASIDDLHSFHSQYTTTIENLQREVVEMRRQYAADMATLQSSSTPQADIQTIRDRYGLSSTDTTTLQSELRDSLDKFETKARTLDVDIRTHATQIDTNIEARRQGVQPGTENLDTRLRRGKLANVGKFAVVGGLTLGSGAYGLATGSMNMKEAAITTAETALTMTPIVGTCLMFYQAISGETLAGQELSTNDRWMTAAFGFLSLATDILGFTTGVGFAAKASLMSAATSIKSAPMATRLGYKIGKLFTNSGRLTTLATSTTKAATAGQRAERALEIARQFKEIPKNCRQIWRPAKNGNKFWGSATGLSKIPYGIGAGLWRAVNIVTHSIGTTIKSIGRLFQTGFYKAARGYNNLKSSAMKKLLERGGVNLEHVDEAVKVINNTIETEVQIARNLKSIADKRRLAGDNTTAIDALKSANEKLLGNAANWTSSNPNVMKVVDIYRNGSNSPLLGAMSNGLRGQRLIAKVETGLSAGLIGGATISGLGGVTNAVVEGDNMITDTASGTYNTAGALLSTTGTVVTQGANIALGVTGHEAMSSNVNRSMERRQREMIVISELKNEWRRMNPVELAYFYLSSQFSRLPARIKSEFKSYTKSRGYNHSQLINIYNSNPE